MSGHIVSPRLAAGISLRYEKNNLRHSTLKQTGKNKIKLQEYERPLTHPSNNEPKVSCPWRDSRQ